MQCRVSIIDYGMGNLNSVLKSFKHTNNSVSVTSNWRELEKSDKIILVGVGHFAKAMHNLNELCMVDVLNELVIEKSRPILGICLGMQLMCNKSDEGCEKGFGWIDANVEKIEVKDKIKYKVPHVGWNQVNIVKDSLLMNGINELEKFYFSHSYCINKSNDDVILNTTKYSSKFISAIEDKNIFGVQYHPEKSHDAGSILLSNFINL